MKFFLEFLHSQSTLDPEFFRGGVWAPIFFGHAKFEVKNLLQFFHLQIALDSEFFQGRRVHAPTFFGDAKFEVKIFQNFFIYRALWTLNFLEGLSGHQLVFVLPNFRSKIFSVFFHLQSALDSELFMEGALSTNFFWSH